MRAAAPVPTPRPVTGSLIASGLTRVHGANVVLDGVDLTVAPGARIGVVGPNGVGKSTLLRVLAGLERPDGGAVRRAPEGLAVGYLDQEHDARPGETGRDYLARHTGVAAAEAEMERLADALAGGGALAEPYADAVERWTALGGPDLDARAAAVCDAIGLGSGVLDRDATRLSGGQAARLRLAATLLARQGVLLLDEPTNDLDFAGLSLLEDLVEAGPAAIVVVSHDRAFLERAVHTVVELDEHTRRATVYEGGWAAYEEERERARRRHGDAYAAYTDRRAELESQAGRHARWEGSGTRRLRRSGETDKFVRWGMKKGAEGQAGRARRAKRALERLDARERVDKPWQPWELRMDVAPARRSGDVVVRLDRAVLERGRFRLGPVDLEIGWSDRVAVVGANGCGKTTLLRGILGSQPLVSGMRWAGPGVEVGELDQVRARFTAAEALDRAFATASGLPYGDARTLLAKYGLGADHVSRPGASLSPGERSRAQLALLAAAGVNCLVLDEPTNHLDLPAIEQLEGVLDRYPGTVVLVSHDRRLLERFDASVTVDVERLRSTWQGPLPSGQ